jgi:hypothetical protein
MELILVDESKARHFILCAVFIEESKSKAVSKALGLLRLGGQSRIHFVAESFRRKRFLLSQYRQMICRVEYFVVRDLPEKASRQLAFEALLMSFDRNQRYRLVIENDENHTQWDRKVISRTIAKLGMDGSVTFEHDNARNQILLWLPDALAWTKARGGDWTHNLSAFECKTIEVN